MQKRVPIGIFVRITIPESPPNIETHDVQPKEARLERVVDDEG